MSAILSVSNLTVRFGGLVALSGVSFDVVPGRITGVIGPNGAGKSTLFNAIAGAVRPSEGNVRFDGGDIAGKTPWQIARLGMSRAFQLVNLFENLTVFENVMVGAEQHSKLDLLQSMSHLFGFRQQQQEALDRCGRALELTGIGDLKDRTIGHLTYGQQRLVATARAIAAEPKILLLDEPAAGLSEIERKQLSNAIRQTVAAGTTVLLVEHDVGFVMDLCSTVVVLHFGRKIAEGTPSDVSSDPTVIEAYLGK